MIPADELSESMKRETTMLVEGKKGTTAAWRFISWGLPLVLLMTGCTGIGAARIEGDRGNYNQAIQRTNDEQLLLNLVRLKYRDTPFFMEVSHVASQFIFSAGADASSGINEGAPGTFGFGAQASFQERPTITYTPLQGDQFIKRVLAPITLQTIALLYDSGWKIDRLFLLCLQRMNKAKNAPSATGPTPDLAPDYEGFSQAVRILRRFQSRDAMELILEINNKFPQLVMKFDAEAQDSPDLREFANLVGVSPDNGRFKLTALDGSQNIRIKTRSLLGIMYYLSQGIEIPVRHQEQGIVTITHDASGRVFDWDNITGDLFKIRSADGRPHSASIAVKHRGTWFYIDDADLSSKSTFSLLAQIFSLQAGGGGGGGLLLTLPIGQ